MKQSLLTLFLVFASLQKGPAQRPVTAFTNATIVDGTGAEPYTGTVVIEGERITGAGAGVRPPEGARVVDASGLTILPGLFDLHTHVTATGAAASGVTADWPKNLMAYLYCGVTTIADLAEYPENYQAVRSLLSTGAVQGPRVAFAKRFSTRGGHGAEGGRPDLHTNEVDTPREARDAMAAVLRGPKPDLIKVFTDGWRYGMSKDMTSMDLETLSAIVEEAHKAGIPVITHTVTVDKAKIAARAGVDIIGHGLGDAPMDQELLSLMREKTTRYVSTLAVYEPKAGRPATPLLAEVTDPAFAERPARGSVSEAQRRRWSVLTGNIALAAKAGVILAAGTDAGMTSTQHGWTSLRELKLLVSGGLTPLQAIRAATSESARALRVDAERGTIAEGKLADFVVIKGRPDRDINDIENIHAVYLGGVEVNRAALRQTITSAAISQLPSKKADPQLDNFERPDGRASNGEMWVDYSDGGHDRSHAMLLRSSRAGGGHSLLVTASMGVKDSPRVEVMLPLHGGGMLPADLSRYKALSFDVRGDGAYRLVLRTRGARNSQWFAAPFNGSGEWSRLTIPFSELKRRGDLKWSGDDVLAVGFEIRRPAGQKAWLELDNIALE